MRGVAQRKKGSGTREGRGKVWGTAAMLLPALFFTATSHVHAVLIDRVVAAVNTEVITWSDLQQAVGFNEAMGGSHNGKLLELQTLEGLINRELLLQEARRLKFVEVSPEDVAAEMEKLKVRLGSEKALSDFLGRLGMTKEDLGRMLGERLLVERFIEKKISLLVRVRHDEALAYFEEHADEFKSKRFPEVQKKIMAFLTEQKVGREVDEYVAELRSKTDIRMNPLRQ